MGVVDLLGSIFMLIEGIEFKTILRFRICFITLWFFENVKHNKIIILIIYLNAL